MTPAAAAQVSFKARIQEHFLRMGSALVIARRRLPRGRHRCGNNWWSCAEFCKCQLGRLAAMASFSWR